MEFDTMENIKKMTKREKFTILLCHLQNDFSPDTKIEGVPVAELIEFVEHEMELLAKKNSGDKKPTAQQTANVALKSAILERMNEQPNRMFTVSEIIKAVPACADLSNQKVSALMNQIKDEHKVEKIVDKGKSYFKVIVA